MSLTIRAAFPEWPKQAHRLRDAVASLTEAQLAIVPGPDRWPLWATIGHIGCQRVFWLCDFANEPGVDATPYPDAAFNCPGDDDLEHVLSAQQLVEGLDASLVIVERCLGTWTFASLDEMITHPEWGDDRAHTRGFVIERVHAHDISHITELNDAFTAAGLPLIDLWG
jgi:DinB superfamily